MSKRPYSSSGSVSVNLELRLEGALIGRSLCSAGNVVGEQRIVFEDARAFQPAYRMDHQDVGCAEISDKLVRGSKGRSELIEPRLDPFIDHREPLRLPALVVLEIFHIVTLHDGRFDRVQSGKHPA